MYSIVIVQDANGNARENEQVQLMFEYGGFTETTWTDQAGRALIEHPKAGQARVYVTGHGEIGTYEFPDTVVVFI